MATNESLKNQLATKKETGIGSAGNTIKSLINSPAIKKRFEEVLDKRAPQYMSSIVNLVNSDTNLKKCDQMSVIASCMVAATMDLPVDKNLGYAWIVPYGNKAQFQMGYKGYVQLALRTGQYKSINVIEVHEGELEEWNPLTEELKIDFSKKESDAVIGYAGYFELLNGFKKSTYWTKEQITKHKNKFSKSDFGWKKDFDAMAKKTVLRNLLSKWGILSIEMQNAYVADNNIVKNIEEGTVQVENSIDFETGEVIEDVEYSDQVQESFEGTPFENVE